ncbi:histidine phosphatase family protein, partial [Streptomyces sp. NPDC005047]
TGADHGGALARVPRADGGGPNPAWLTDPDAAPHGGESVRGICRRTANWLSSLPPEIDSALAIAEPAVLRAALIHALSEPTTAFWHLDVPPLSVVSLVWRGGRWSVQLGPVWLRGWGHVRGAWGADGAVPTASRPPRNNGFPAPVAQS